MTAGKGFIALAALIFAKWRAWPALGACFLFGLLDASRSACRASSLPGIGEVPVQAIQALPYLMTVILLAGFIGTRDPAARLRHALREGALSMAARSTLCSRPPGRSRPRPMRPIPASRSAPRSPRRTAQVFAGCNVENAAYPVGTCAEAGAISAMVAGGAEPHRRRSWSSARASISSRPAAAAASASANSPRPTRRSISPAPRASGSSFTLDELLPFSFGPDNLTADRPADH